MASHPRFVPPEYHTGRFLAEKETPFFVFTVPQKGGSQPFTHPLETTARASLRDAFPSQPAQFQPRTDWSHWPQAGPGLLSLNDSKAQVREKLSRSAATPSEPFQNGGKVGSRNWLDHQVNLWQHLQAIQRQTQEAKTSFNGLVKAPADIDVTPFLSLIQAGLESQVGIMLQPICVTGQKPFKNPPPRELNHREFIPEGAQLMNGDFHMGFDTAIAWKEEMFNRRFFIGYVKFDIHWVSIIWDRHCGHLYVYDTDGRYNSRSVDRETRIHHVALAFRQVLAWGGMPFDFDVFAPPFTLQDSNWESGYLSTTNLLVSIRGLVGLSYAALRTATGSKVLVVDRKKRAPASGFELRHRDWKAEPWLPDKTDYVRELNQANLVLQVIIMDELGIQDLKFENGKGDVVQLTDMAGSDMTYLPQTSTTLESEAGNIYTNFGGAQYVIFNSRKVVPGRTYGRVIPMPKPIPELARPSLRHSRSNVRPPYHHTAVSVLTSGFHPQRGTSMHGCTLSEALGMELPTRPRRLGGAAPAIQIEGALRVIMDDKTISEHQNEAAPLYDDAPVAEDIVLGISELLDLRPVGHTTWYMPTHGTYETYMLHGLMGEKDWDRVIDKAYDATNG
ncbi:hypothetical protein G7Z17_g1102 [Cylindrodendrum hubeiense]|uniref:Uncharacterized protein n=1 Tax=Cylindrodendrum hubeiense TaxID=595255 RepID=A0A9P5LKD9_9HYPO|nr:hypothetical protein G7Z17_g1102 [Cylindrodendrum hubeiense]